MATIWQEWAGGEMPVPYNTPIQVQHRNGKFWYAFAGQDAAEEWGIDPLAPNEGDIIAWRLVPNEMLNFAQLVKFLSGYE